VELSKNRIIPKYAINDEICTKCAEKGLTCCERTPCEYAASDFDEFNEEVLMRMLLENNAVITYGKKYGYHLRPRTDRDEDGKYLIDHDPGMCVHLNHEWAKSRIKTYGCNLSKEMRPGFAIHYIPTENGCYLAEDFKDDPTNNFGKYRDVFVNVLTQLGELWYSPHTGQQIFESPCDLYSHAWYQTNTINFIQYLVNVLGSDCFIKDLDYINWEEKFTTQLNAELAFADFDNTQIYNLYFNIYGIVFVTALDYNLLSEILGDDFIIDHPVTLENIKNYLAGRKIQVNISCSLNTLYQLCKEKKPNFTSLRKHYK